jgi:hypothetical protein
MFKAISKNSFFDRLKSISVDFSLSRNKFLEVPLKIVAMTASRHNFKFNVT